MLLLRLLPLLLSLMVTVTSAKVLTKRINLILPHCPHRCCHCHFRCCYCRSLPSQLSSSSSSALVLSPMQISFINSIQTAKSRYMFIYIYTYIYIYMKVDIVLQVLVCVRIASIHTFQFPSSAAFLWASKPGRGEGFYQAEGGN